MKSVEEQLWDYIDGTCTADEQQATRLLIDTDTVYANKYQELLQLNQEFSAVEPDEPSMAFTYNVMGAIRAEQAQKPLKTHINPYIIAGIAAFFIIMILAGVATIFSGANSPVSSTPANTLTLPEFKNYFSRPVLNTFLFFDTLLGLFLLDTFLRRKSALKHT